MRKHSGGPRVSAERPYSIFLDYIETNLKQIGCPMCQDIHLASVLSGIQNALYYCQEDPSIWAAAGRLQSAAFSAARDGDIAAAQSALEDFRRELGRAKPSSVAQAHDITW